MPAVDLWTQLLGDVLVAFSGRRGGKSTGRFAEANVSLSVGDDRSAVNANRALLLERLGISSARLATVRQRHGADVITVTHDALPAPPAPADMAVPADGMVTRDRGICLLVGVADCAPVVLVDPAETVVGVFHVGWRGLVAGIVPAGVASMQRLGAAIPRTRALVGRTIGACCYPVGHDVRDRVARRYPRAAARSRDQRPALDLPAGIHDALGRVGIDDVVSVGGCTADDVQGSFSRRRDGETGCQAGLVVVTDAEPRGDRYGGSRRAGPGADRGRS